MSKKNPKELFSTHEGELKIGDRTLSVAVLNDGRRVITQSAMFEAFGRPIRGSRAKGDQDTPKLPGLIDAKNLKPFISKELEGLIKPIIYNNKNNTESLGYDANVLPLICDVYLEANDAMRISQKAILTAKQIPNVRAAEALIRSLARVGIIALVDEVTGYEKEKDKEALQQFLQKFLKQEHGKWIKTFDDEFFETIYKMKNWNWKLATKGQKPGVMGKYINDLVWARLAPSVMDELNERNPKTEKGYRKFKNPQFIDPEFGHPILKDHIKSVVTLGKASGYSWVNFLRLMNRAFPRFDKTLEIDFENEEQDEN